MKAAEPRGRATSEPTVKPSGTVFPATIRLYFDCCGCNDKLHAPPRTVGVCVCVRWSKSRLLWADYVTQEKTTPLSGVFHSALPTSVWFPPCAEARRLRFFWVQEVDRGSVPFPSRAEPSRDSGSRQRGLTEKPPPTPTSSRWLVLAAAAAHGAALLWLILKIMNLSPNWPTNRHSFDRLQIKKTGIGFFFLHN